MGLIKARLERMIQELEKYKILNDKEMIDFYSREVLKLQKALGQVSAIEVEFTPQQEKMIVQGFADYKAKHGAKQIIRETSPRKGYVIDGQFFSDDSIIKPFLDKYKEIKSEQ